MVVVVAAVVAAAVVVGVDKAAEVEKTRIAHETDQSMIFGFGYYRCQPFYIQVYLVNIIYGTSTKKDRSSAG